MFLFLNIFPIVALDTLVLFFFLQLKKFLDQGPKCPMERPDLKRGVWSFFSRICARKLSGYRVTPLQKLTNFPLKRIISIGNTSEPTIDFQGMTFKASFRGFVGLPNTFPNMIRVGWL